PDSDGTISGGEKDGAVAVVFKVKRLSVFDFFHLTRTSWNPKEICTRKDAETPSTRKAGHQKLALVFGY
ncbi:MAG: hypothetical protein ACE5HS_19055, partial [bacterium]